MTRRARRVARCAALVLLLAAAASRTEGAPGRGPAQPSRSKPANIKSAAPASASSGASACPVSEQKPCAVELHGAKGPSVSPNCTAEPWSRFVTLTLPDRISDSNHDGWWETVMKIAIDASKGCSCATFRVFYDAPPDGYSVNIGDSPTNNGSGGDEGTTFKEAEMEIAQNRLEVFTASRGGGARNVEKIFENEIPPLAGRSLDLKICDESLEVSISGGPGGAHPLSWKLQTPSSGLLYDLTPSASYAGVAASKRRADGIYAAFNRVIHDKGSAPSPANRTGTGVRRVEIRLAP